jgi:hypothetical protein
MIHRHREGVAVGHAGHVRDGLAHGFGAAGRDATTVDRDPVERQGVGSVGVELDQAPQHPDDLL